MEYLSYYVNIKYLKKSDIDEMISGSISFYYSIFEGYIKFRQKKYGKNKSKKNDTYYFKQLSKLSGNYKGN